jgi:Fe-S-cluster-containing hydrogenase component 2/CRP-like cAMP-binding protein
MAKERKLVLNPPAELETRPGDVPLLADRFLDFSLFARLKKKPNVERFPGTLVLRHYQRGEVICRQGEAGWTAFYPLTGDDVLGLRRQQMEAATQTERAALQAEVARLEAVVAQTRAAGTPRPAATVYLSLARGPETADAGFITRLGRRLAGHAARPAGRWLPYIAVSNLRGVSHETRQATLYEGELFGEMSCMYGSPRSATVVAGEDCFALEMLRNILDEVQSDDGYRAHVDQLYRERVLKNHLRRLPIFSDLTEEQFDRLRDGVELVRYKVGQVICAENDRSDSMYIIRSGVVKAVKNASALLTRDDIADWSILSTRLPQGELESGPLAEVWRALPEAARQALGRSEEGREGVLHGLNEVIKNAPLPDPKNPKAMQQLPPDRILTEYVGGLPKDAKQWPDLDRYLYGRLLLEAVLPGALRPYHGPRGPESVLSYLTAGDFIGEVGVLTGRPRSATCLAYAHPEPGQGHKKSGPSPKWRREEALAELVRIPEGLFRRLVDESPAVRAKVEAAVVQRRARSAELERAPAWEDRRGLHMSAQFEELGLVQGKRLMLIDLERCTRCDECVRACVDTHDDGRTRLFLDGPRFGKYLVPTTCRSCLDPVCMIGCPVGSIHRGDNREMVIENWCIGCGLCATNCPYGSIQMHDIGIIPEGSHGWRYYPAAALGGPEWTRPNYRDRRWLLGRTPFRHDLDLRAALQDVPAVASNGDAGLCFRYEFHLQAGQVKSAGEFRLEATSTDGPLTVWVNGREITTEEKPKRGKREYRIAKEAGLLRAGRNVLAVRVTPTPRDLELLLEVRLDDVRRPVVPAGMVGDISEKMVTERAVVCDLCSGQYGQRPACVNACPHDAAMRVDAILEFPER